MRQVLSWNMRRKICFLLHSGKQTLQINLCGWVQLRRVENILRFCLFVFFQSITGKSQRKFRKQVRAHKLTKEPLDMQEQFIKHVSIIMDLLR